MESVFRQALIMNNACLKALYFYKIKGLIK